MTVEKVRQAINGFRTVLEDFEAGLPKQRLEKLRWRERKRLGLSVVRVLQARDRLEQCLDEYDAGMLPGAVFWQDEAAANSTLNVPTDSREESVDNSENAQISSIGQEVDELHQRLKSHKSLIAKVLELDEESKKLKPEGAGEWWSFPVPIKFLDRFDWLFNFGTSICTIGSLGLAASLIPLFWAGGPNTFGALAGALSAIAPGVLGVLSLEKATQAKKGLEEAFEQNRLPKQCQQEVIFGGSVLVLILLGMVFLNKPMLANHFFQKGEEKLNKIKDGEGSVAFTSSEPLFQLATAFDPDHTAAHFRLGWLYELRKDMDKARNEYKLAMNSPVTQQNSTVKCDWAEKCDWALMSRVRLANLILVDNFFANAESKETKEADIKAESKETKEVNIQKSAHSAAAILLQGWEDKEETEDTEAHKSWVTVLGWARLQEQRYEEAEEILDDAVNELKEIFKQYEKKYQNSGGDGIGKAAFCVRAELNDILSHVKERKAQIKTQEIEAKSSKNLNQLVTKPNQQKIDALKKEIEDLRTGVQQHKEGAKEDWCSCSRYASVRDPDEDIWIGKARLRIRENKWQCDDSN